MRFELTDEQSGFARSLDDLLSKADTARGEPCLGRR